MHFIARKLLIEVSFWHYLCTLDTLYRLIVVVVDDNDFELEHGAVVYDTALFGDTFGPFNGNVIVLGCKDVPDLFGDGYEIVVLLFFLVYDSVEVIELVEGYLVEGFTVGYKIVVNLSRMFFANFFMFFLIIFTQVIVTDILSPILKPLSADDKAVVKLLLFKDFAFIIQ